MKQLHYPNSGSSNDPQSDPQLSWLDLVGGSLPKSPSPRCGTWTFAGAVITAAGLFILIKGPSYAREESVFKLGDIEAKVQQERSVPEWIGGAAFGAGPVLVGVGLKKRCGQRWRPSRRTRIRDAERTS